MKKNFLFIIMLIASLCIVTGASAAGDNIDEVPSEVKIAAEKGLEFFKSKVSSSPEEYG